MEEIGENGVITMKEAALVLRLLADRADAVLASADMPCSTEATIEGLRLGLAELGEGLKALYIQMTGDNLWWGSGGDDGE